MDELELAVADSVAAEAREAVAAQPSHTRSKCLNCEAKLQGPYCHVCGQSSDDHHRSIIHLLWEAIEGFTHLDGRLAKTLPALLFHPGQLARDHIEGRRMRHVPPFRMFLISLLLFMFAAEWAVNGQHASVHVRHAASTKALQSSKAGDTKGVVEKDTDIQNITEQEDHSHSPLHEWLKTHIGRAVQNREFYLMLVFSWAHRLAVLILPILAGLLTLSYVYKREFYIYDHLVVSMQYLSFCFLVWAVVWMLPSPLSGLVMTPALIWTPFNLYLVLRRAYGSSRIGAVLKAVVLWLATVTAFGCLVAGLLVFALNEM